MHAECAKAPQSTSELLRQSFSTPPKPTGRRGLPLLPLLPLQRIRVTTQQHPTHHQRNAFMSYFLYTLPEQTESGFRQYTSLCIITMSTHVMGMVLRYIYFNPLRDPAFNFPRTNFFGPERIFVVGVTSGLPMAILYAGFALRE